MTCPLSFYEARFAASQQSNPIVLMGLAFLLYRGKREIGQDTPIYYRISSKFQENMQ